MAFNVNELATKMLPLLDEVFKKESKTAILDAAPNRIQFDGSKTIKYFQTTMDGLGDYDRTTGFVKGDVTGKWVPLTLSIDRGRSFSIDRMDNEESLMMAFGTLSGEFIRTKVVPEVDAIRFAKYASAQGILTTAGATLDSSTVVSAIDAAQRAMDDAEVDEEGRYLFVTPEVYAALKASSAVTRFVGPGQGINREFEEFDNMPVIKVPQARFYTAIELKDGTTEGQEGGGYTKASDAKEINFMIIHRSAVLQVTKHVLPRIFDPDTNQEADAWKFDYRIYHDAFVYDNKTKGIYVHHK